MLTIKTTNDHMSIYQQHHVNLLGLKVPFGNKLVATYKITNTESPVVALDLHKQITFEELGKVITAFDIFFFMHHLSYPVMVTKQAEGFLSDMVNELYKDKEEAKAVLAHTISTIMEL